MTRITVAAGLALTVGCGAAAQRPPDATAQALRRTEAERDDLRETNANKEQQIRELQAQLSLARAEIRQLRGGPAQRPARTVRLGGKRQERAADDNTEEAPAPRPDEAERADRPVLRLHGDGSRHAASARRSELPDVPALPEGLPERLPVAPLPDEEPPADVTASERAGSETASSGDDADPAVAAYRRALSMVRDRQFGEALEAFARFAKAHPDHPYADNALYWRGEMLYALGRFDRARAQFERLLSRYADGNKAPDALLKMGLCLRRMGRAEAAREAFRRLRRDYPDSVAARIASREESS